MNTLYFRFLKSGLPIYLLLLFGLLVGWFTHPFASSDDADYRSPVSIDLIPDLSENQQIVYVEWPGRSPQDVELYITEVLSTQLLGMTGVKTIRASSTFGRSSLTIIFDDSVDFHTARAQIVDRFNTIETTLLPEGVVPKMGPSATGLGQVFWYTLQAVSLNGEPSADGSLYDLRTLQDEVVKPALTAVEGVAEVSSIGGMNKEFQVNVYPEKLNELQISLAQIASLLQQENRDVGARTIEMNQMEYFVRGLARVSSIQDLEDIVVLSDGDSRVLLNDIADIRIGPKERRGVLDLNGQEVVGGVVVVQQGVNVSETIQRIRDTVPSIEQGLPVLTDSKGQAAFLKITPVYDRNIVISEAIENLEKTLLFEILCTTVVILVLAGQFRALIVIAGTLPYSVGLVFGLMRWMDLEANILSLAGIAIAIGTMVDLAIIMVDSLESNIGSETPKWSALVKGVIQVQSAIITAVATTIIGFLPIFALEAAEGKLFHPLAWTKTFSLTAALFTALFAVPLLWWWARILDDKLGLTGRVHRIHSGLRWGLIGMAIVSMSLHWMPMGLLSSWWQNTLMVSGVFGAILGLIWVLRRYYVDILRSIMPHAFMVMLSSLLVPLIGGLIWLGAPDQFAFMKPYFPGLGTEFMPPLDEGDLLVMPTTVSHAGVEYNTRVLQDMDARIASIPEVKNVLGKMGRVESALDPAPISMMESIITLAPEWAEDEHGEIRRFQSTDGLYHSRDGLLQRWDEIFYSEAGIDLLIEDPSGLPFRQWRPHIEDTDDIWLEIEQQTPTLGLTSSPKLHPIQTRLVMLQTGLRTPLGLKVIGQSLEDIDNTLHQLDVVVRQSDAIVPTSVFVENMFGKPYFDLMVDREQVQSYGITANDVQQTIQTAIGGRVVGEVLDNRARHDIRLRIPKDLRQHPEAIQQIPVSLPNGAWIPLSEVTQTKITRGPGKIASEDGALIGYILFAGKPDLSNGEVIAALQSSLQQAVTDGQLSLPTGVRLQFDGTFEQQRRAEQRLAGIVPIVCGLIALLLYWQFQSVIQVLFVISGIAIAFGGGMMGLWLVAEPWFLDVDVWGQNLRAMFHLDTIHLSVAVWVGFVALFGIATDDGVLMGTIISERLRLENEQTESLLDRVVGASKSRIGPATLTTATTLVALVPVFTSSGRGADVMIPMMVPLIGGMTASMWNTFLVPVLYYWWYQRQDNKQRGEV